MFISSLRIEFCRWDVNMMQDLPDYMKIAFLALCNTTNELAYDILKEKGLDIIPYMRKAV